MEPKESRYLRIFQEISKTISTTLAVEQRLKVEVSEHERQVFGLCLSIAQGKRRQF